MGGGLRPSYRTGSLELSEDLRYEDVRRRCGIVERRMSGNAKATARMDLAVYVTVRNG
jgi:hypothetical protein